MSEVIHFPGNERSLKISSREGIDKGHAKAFRILEPEINDLDRWAELADMLISDCVCDQRSWRELEIAALIVERLQELVKDFKSNYYAAWKGAVENADEAPAPVA